MPSYLISGVSRGMGFEFLKQLSSDDSNVIFGFGRNSAATQKKVSEEIGDRKNIHLLEGDLVDHASIKASVATVEKITGGSLDYLIANGAIMSSYSTFRKFAQLAEDPVALEDDLIRFFRINVVGNINLINEYMPLILKGTVKKIISITSGFADADTISKHDFSGNPSYPISKAAMNMAMAKFSAEYRKDGVLCMSIAPGVVATSGYEGDEGPHVETGMQEVMSKLSAYAPHFTGPAMAEQAVQDVMKVINVSTVEKDYGAFVSQHGDKNWI